MSTEKKIHQLADAAEAAVRAARIAEKDLAEQIDKALQVILPQGSMIDLSAKPLPDHLREATVRIGNAHGTTLFRVVSCRVSQVDACRLCRTTWTCEAVPVSLTTGKDMSGRTASIVGRGTTVQLYGTLGAERAINEDLSVVNERVLEVLAAALESA